MQTDVGNRSERLTVISLSKSEQSSTWRLTIQDSRDSPDVGLEIIANAKMMTMALPADCYDSSGSCYRQRDEMFTEGDLLFVGGWGFDLVDGTLVPSKCCWRLCSVGVSRFVVSGMPTKRGAP